MSPAVSGEQTIQIYDPIVLKPSILAFPLIAERRYEHQMKVILPL
jgi:hypothetical protein